MAWSRRNVFKGLFALVLLTVVVITALTDVRVRRRAQALVWKATGSLPDVTWPELYKALVPSRLKSGSTPPGYFVTEKQRGEEPCPVLWETPQGDFWGQREDNVTLQDPVHLARYETGPVTIHSGDVVIDVGSQIGTFTRLALTRGAAKVVAIEPDPTNNTCFKRTFEKEIADGRVILIEAALWEKPGTTKFVVASRSDAGEVAATFGPRWKAVRTVDVPTARLDDTIEGQNLPHVDFIKWAIGGATQPALRGARQTLARFRPRMAMTMVIDTASDDPVMLPRLAREAVPSYNIFTSELLLMYFY